jgi:hypothetical protein
MYILLNLASSMTQMDIEICICLVNILNIEYQKKLSFCMTYVSQGGPLACDAM